VLYRTLFFANNLLLGLGLRINKWTQPITFRKWYT